MADAPTTPQSVIDRFLAAAVAKRAARYAAEVAEAEKQDEEG